MQPFAHSNSMLARRESNRNLQIETANRNVSASRCAVDALNPTQKYTTHRNKTVNGPFSDALGGHRRTLPPQRRHCREHSSTDRANEELIVRYLSVPLKDRGYIHEKYTVIICFY
jgi:hypothetical protein